ncbi:MAG: PH domain-containing protein, partial [Gemmatimonadales bacterium]
MGNEQLLESARFDPKLRTYWFLQVVLIFVATIAGIALLPIWMLGWGQWYVRRTYEALQCELHERSLVVRRGIFFKVEKTIPLDKIQDLTVREGPLLRALGLRSLKIETAGQGTPGQSEADLVGIVDPLEFRNRVMDQKDLMTGVSPVPAGGDGGGQPPENSIELLTEIRN